ncbi:MAG: hypothetical protein AB7O45_11915 [Alphaproteobacteria bacterium]
MTADRPLTANEARVLAAVVARVDAGRPDPRNVDLARDAGLADVSTVSRLIGHLVALGYLRIGKGRGGGPVAGTTPRRIEVLRREPAPAPPRDARSPSVRALDDPELQRRAIAIYTGEGLSLSLVAGRLGLQGRADVLDRLRAVMTAAGVRLRSPSEQWRVSTGNAPWLGSNGSGAPGRAGDWPDGARFEDHPRAPRWEPPWRPPADVVPFSVAGCAAARCVEQGETG